MADQGNDERMAAPAAVLYDGDQELDVPVESWLHAMKAIIAKDQEDAFLQQCGKLPPEQLMLLTSPELVNLMKSFIEDKKLFTFSIEAMEIMTSPPHKRCWPRNDM
jgi:hypothetical protein